MRPENEARLRKIRRISGVLQGFCKGFQVLVVIGFGLVALALFTNRGGSVGYFNALLRPDQLTVCGRLVVLAMSGLASGVMYRCVSQLHQLFSNYSRGEVFTRGSVGVLRQLAIACIAWGVIKVAWVGMWWALTPHPPKSFEANTDTVPIGMILFAVAWFMDMAVELREENELTV
jgi:hypothetical protein